MNGLKKMMFDQHWVTPMLDSCTSECMVPIININNNINEPTIGYQNSYPSQIFIFGGYLKV